MGIILEEFFYLFILNVSKGQHMQEEHLVHLKKNKILISVMLLHFGVFHNSSLLLTLASPAAPGRHSYLPWDGGLRQTNTQLDFGQCDPTHFIKHQQETRKKQLKLRCKLLQSSLFPPLLSPPITKTASPVLLAGSEERLVQPSAMDGSRNSLAPQHLPYTCMSEVIGHGSHPPPLFFFFLHTGKKKAKEL